ncbi:MAG: peptide-methionine (S)-S-oxide reductase MsrA [Candidatus Thiodiazotropha lotti]|uniref:Peptide methionine sulfoxide reductase MsrA n=1 Tax=Candidatus Thiodiazotropha lotti TaxID=2792787 RepID=A0A9E4K783_9GAMM|nr:peptide-methionine (S)-S-oxide reductase MsrA [Candidatus Thiodiazotropha lotti]ODB98808.1 peptide-methionine (S)-S-oxide reductase [Candidatus Thiodiazotropha endoloripes]MCG7919988.1 peptide-methionine (S)-S-oxide reductase MsrA [Candidatus Thiodiazotropha lotti]MCG7932361.1 peptide-methionine (S)-S-oxide reductase MsrA [Candidatus Thiodiazotropha lotti]MCG7940479.1 peptide-methionine (S)-S-oxide reductase MsrA [Candidatus Thiodiazotropha lotti]
MFGLGRKTKMPAEDEALPGRTTPIQLNAEHFVSGHRILPPFPQGMKTAMFGMGCFWGAERRFWSLDGVYSTAVGYAAGSTPNPTYKEVCTGMTGHNEVVLVVYDPAKIDYQTLLKTFWESHNPTEGMRQGNDVGTQYRSGIYTFDDDQRVLAQASREDYQHALAQVTSAPITTEIVDAPPLYYAEDYHQQYLAKNPAGYCGLGGTGVCYPA